MTTFLSRARRVVSGGVDELLTAAERASGDALVREAIRDMDAAIDAAHEQRARAALITERAQRDAADLAEQRTAREEDARYALAKDRRELAAQAIALQLDLEAEVAALEQRATHAAAERDALDAALADLAERRAAMAAGAVRGGDVPAFAIDPRILHQAAEAETAFARAISRLGREARVPTLDALRREDEIAARLAALDTEASKPSRRKRG